MAKSKPRGFGERTYPKRKFQVELKSRDLESGEERTVGWKEVEVPRQKDSQKELQEAITQISDFLYSEDAERWGVNQVFLLNADGNETIARLETQDFSEEEECDRLAYEDGKLVIGV